MQTENKSNLKLRENDGNQDRSPWIDYLRSFITFLVIAHHSALAYATFSVFNKQAYILSTHPVVDTGRWIGMDVFIIFNDSFFMSLMFLISGLFALKSLEKKRPLQFIRERLIRLFVPFLIAVSVLNLIAYYPAYLLSDKPSGLVNYSIDFFSVEAWPVGPLWFIWVLFFFNCLLALLYQILAPWLLKAGAFIRNLKPWVFMVVFICLTWILMVPFILLFGPDTWTGIGPFDFQKSRVAVYFGCFLIGCFMGKGSLKADFLSLSGITKKWPYLIVGSCGLFMLMRVKGQSLGTLTYFSLFSCLAAVTTLAFLSSFRRFANRKQTLWSSFSTNAYGIYLVHYMWVIWCQYVLLPFALPVLVKFSITLIISVLGSWILTKMLRRIPAVRAFI
jgi:glucan biosynthesis protein C